MIAPSDSTAFHPLDPWVRWELRSGVSADESEFIALDPEEILTDARNRGTAASEKKGRDVPSP